MQRSQQACDLGRALASGHEDLLNVSLQHWREREELAGAARKYTLSHIIPSSCWCKEAADVGPNFGKGPRIDVVTKLLVATLRARLVKRAETHAYLYIEYAVAQIDVRPVIHESRNDVQADALVQ